MKAFEKVIFLLPTILFAVLLIAAAARAQGGSVVVLDQTVRAAITSNLTSWFMTSNRTFLNPTKCIVAVL